MADRNAAIAGRTGSSPRLGLGLKLGGAFAAVILLAAAMAAAAMMSLRQATDASEEIAALMERALHQVEQEVHHLDWTNRLANSFILAGALDIELDHTRCDFGRWYYAFRGSLAYAAAGPDFRDAFDALEGPHHRLHQSAQRIGELFLQQQRDQAIMVYRDQTRSHLTEMRTGLDALGRILTAERDAMVAGTRREAHKALIVLTAMVALIIVLSIILATAIVRPITGAMRELAETTDRMARGDLSGGELTIRHHDEIGTAAAAFNRMSRHIRQLVSEITEEIAARKRAEAQLLAWNTDLESQVAKRTRELELAKEQAEAASHAKSAFLSNMSHEIRTPMNSLLGMAHLALHADPPPKLRDYLRKIHQSGEHLLGIVNDILDFSKIEAGKVTLEPRDFDLALLRESVESMFTAKAKEKGLRFHVEVDPAVPSRVHGDLLRIKQILINLVGNALKFTRQGEVALRIGAERRRNQRIMLRFEVTDTGIGMDRAQLAHLFESFHQANATISREYGGTGLGLAISRQLAELMGGEIGVDSAPQRGSTFWFVVPLEEGGLQPGEEDAPQRIPHLQVLPGTRILLAEDNPLNQQVATELLERAGATVTVAGDGAQALERLRAGTFDCVLMDIQMPGMDGLDATRRLRDDPELAEICVIAMTANASAEDRAACFQVGMNAFITKPIDPPEMYATLARCLQCGETPPPPPEEVASPSDVPAGDAEVIDLRHLAERVGDDPALLQSFAETFIASARQGLVEMETALAQHDGVALAAAGHRLKSSAMTVGAARFGELCRSLEPYRDRPEDTEPARPTVDRLYRLLDDIVEYIDGMQRPGPA